MQAVSMLPLVGLKLSQPAKKLEQRRIGGLVEELGIWGMIFGLLALWMLRILGLLLRTQVINRCNHLIETPQITLVEVE